MKFFNIEIRNVTVYGIIYSTGMFEVNFWDFDADDYNFHEGKKANAREAWNEIAHLARDINRINHTFNGIEETPIAEFFEDDLELLNLDEEWE